MNLDITFCEARACELKETCNRWTANMVKDAKKAKIDLTYRGISVADFSNHPGDCEMYSPRDNWKINASTKA